MQDLKETARNIRRKVLEMIYKTQSPHIGGCFSCVDILLVLYFKILKLDPDNKKDKNRDIFILSKGHAGPALYTVLAERGFFGKEKLEQFSVDEGIFEYHPKRNLDLGIELTTGSLGHGLSVSTGMALARKIDNSKSRVFVLSSDGDMEEGCVWPALMFAAKHKLDNLTVIIDYNKIQAISKVEDVFDMANLKDKINSFGFETKEVDGHDLSQLINVLSSVPFEQGKPSAVIAHTIKGKGVSFMENKIEWHSKHPSKEEFEKALEELK
ncbi:transketolase [Parcubacteria bacterium DG_72]|nr:MAG: transketolase [Parcubacteria bacterium DG_72]